MPFDEVKGGACFALVVEDPFNRVALFFNLETVQEPLEPLAKPACFDTATQTAISCSPLNTHLFRHHFHVAMGFIEPFECKLAVMVVSTPIELVCKM